MVTHHCSDLPHILPTQSTTLDLPHFPVTDISAVIISSHTSQQVISLYILWIVSRAYTARDYLARSTKSSRSITWGSGPLLCMACTSPIGFNWFLCTITEKFGVSTLVFLCCFQLPKQENLHKPFEWHSKINMAHTYQPIYIVPL